MPVNYLNFIQKHSRDKLFLGFTLAEVLITLGIIGIVAALTIPALLKNTQDAEYKSAYKKAFAEASNVWQQMRVNNEIEPCTSACDDTCTSSNLVAFRSYMKVQTSCGTNIGSDNAIGCWNLAGEGFNEVSSSGSNFIPRRTDGTGAIGFIDNSGRNWIMMSGSFSCRVPLAVDTNGFKPPNKFGKDRQYILGGLNDGTTGAFIGIPVKLFPAPDRYSSVSQLCGYYPCYGTSWLYN